VAAVEVCSQVVGSDCPFLHVPASKSPTQGESGDKPHVGIAGVTLHKPRPISIIEDTNRCSFRLQSEGRVASPAGRTYAPPPR